MRKVIHKLFWLWDFEKEEQWLNEMAAKGLALVGVGFCRYEFEDCVPGEYRVCMEMLENKAGSPEGAQYISFLEETGAEHVGTLLRWAYFRKKTADGDFALFSDNASRIKYLTMILQFIILLGGVNVYIVVYNLLMFYLWHNRINLLGFINLLAAGLAAMGLFRLLQIRKKLKKETQIFE